jgi:hypothetical protein
MSLDLYAGPLTRYFCGQWENIMARTAREQGLSYQVIRPDSEPAPEPEDPAFIESHIATWAELLSQSLGENISSPIAWADNISQPYETDRPHWPGYCGLLLTAAHADHPEHPLPATTPERWDDHPAFVASTAPKSGSKFTQILLPELWLPSSFDFAFRAPDPAGDDPVWIGSVPTLLVQLDRLNSSVFHASADDLDRWQHDGPPADNNLPGCARFAFAVFHRLTTFAQRENLPLKLDY